MSRGSFVDQASLMSPRIFAGVTLGLLLLGLFSTTHELGATAVYGHGYLWGEDGLRVNVGATIVHFVDDWEKVQHALFGLAIATTALAWFRRGWLALLALAFTAVVLACLRRSVLSDPEYWAECDTGFFTACVGWAISLWGIALATWLRARSVARDAAPAPAARQLDP